MRLRFCYRCLLVVPYIAFTLLLAASASHAQNAGKREYAPSDVVAARLGLSEAQQIIEEEIREGLAYGKGLIFEGRMRIVGVSFESNRIVLKIGRERPVDVVIPVADIQSIEVRAFSHRGGDTLNRHGIVITTRDPVPVWLYPHLGGFSYRLKNASIRIADALHIVRLHQVRRQAEEDRREDARFEELAAQYRGKSRPDFPEEARRFRVQAEVAVQDKRFGDAADRYEDALKIAPWWPEGRFNRALVLGETSRHADAIREMKKYLLLFPDAPNARAAQDKIYEWEGKAGRK